MELFGHRPIDAGQRLDERNQYFHQFDRQFQSDEEALGFRFHAFAGSAPRCFQGAGEATGGDTDSAASGAGGLIRSGSICWSVRPLTRSATVSPISSAFTPRREIIGSVSIDEPAASVSLRG